LISYYENSTVTKNIVIVIEARYDTVTKNIVGVSMGELEEKEKKIRTYLVLIAFTLFSVTLIGLFWLATAPAQTLTLSLAYAAGLSMILLPCTLPLVFVIVPLSMGKGYRKGLIMALLFGLGLTITLTLWGGFTAAIGKFLGVDRATRSMFFVAGIAAFTFGLSELKLVRFQAPAYAGMPGFIHRQGEYLKALFLGLFLGNAGVGCPNPAFYVLLAYIATIGDVFQGGTLGFIHGLGRATPLIFLSILAILGVNASKSLVEKRATVGRLTGWALVVIGAFILNYGLFGMYWWEASIFHQSWNALVEGVAPSLAESAEAGAAAGKVYAPSELEKYLPRFPWAFMLSMIGITAYWRRCRNA
jgi:cytochrome c-type biogenesis protein